jgi:predicted helicase
MTWIFDGTGDREHTFGPEDILNYIYAIFYSPTFRERYAELLKSDFPQVPLTGDPSLFRALCALGDHFVGDKIVATLGTFQ